MSFFRKKEPRKKSFYEGSDRIFLYRGSFYWSVTKKDSMHNTFTVIPGDDIPYEEFRKLAMDCAEKMLSMSFVVLNDLYCSPLEPAEGTLSESVCVKQYVEQGGTPVFAAKNELYTVSAGIDRQLVKCVPEATYGYYGLSFYGYKMTEDASLKLSIALHYHEDHQYLEVSAPEDASKYIDIVREASKVQGREVVFLEE